MSRRSGSRSPQIAIVGAGFGGLAVALELKQAGIDSFTVLERAGEVGGVWQANTYPGAACDVPSVIYQFSRHLKPDWSRRFGSQREIRDYLHAVSHESGIREHIRFGAEVVAATYDGSRAGWTVELAGGETLAVDILVCATGQLSRPKLPDVEGRETFAGAQFHSAEWDHSVRLEGKRVVVVGGGASAVQVVPAIVDAAAHVTVVQRSPSWIVNKYDWTQGRTERALSHIPALLRAYHHLMWWWFESRYPIVLRTLDPVRRGWEAWRRRAIRRIVRDPAKVAACTPDYALGCNRILLSRDWYPAIARRDVDVVRAGVAAMTPGGVVTSEGREIEADVVVWCTGFTATEYLAPIRITGRDGVEIREAWAAGPEAYLGLATPGFPNLFMSYGPNTGSLTNTIISLLEYQARYIRQAAVHVAGSGGALEVRRDVHDAFNAELQQRLRGTVFTSGCPGWYTTADGKVTTVWAGSHVEYRRRTRRFDPSAYRTIAEVPRYTRPGPEPVEPPGAVALIPERPRPDGPVTTARLRRSVTAYGAAVVGGAALTRAAGQRPLANAGLGLAVPGAGLLGAGRPGAFTATQAAFGLSLVAWLGSGNIVAPAATWLGSAALSARRGARPAGRLARTTVPLAAAGAVAGAWAARERGHRAAIARRDRRNAHLRAVAAREPATPRRLPEPEVGPELTPDELALARYALDRALQPVAEWDGFDTIEQFQTSSVRYQVTTMGHVLASLQYARMPAFHGYLNQAQRNLIDKWQERVCWSYWAKESTWGHLRYNPDPVPRDNIMLTGWLGYQIAGYVSNTGDTRYSEPGSITFRHPRGHEYRYDLHSITGALVENFERSDFCLYPCEPNWIYALCNGYGVLPLPMHDRMYGTDYAERVLPAFRRGFEQEFLSTDGRTIGIRSSLTGLTIPAMTSILSDAAVIWQLAPVFPDLARGLWETVRHEWVELPPDGPVQIAMRGWDRIDTGNYRRVPATAFAAITWAAKEMGDMELAGRLLADAETMLDAATEDGVRSYRRASTLSNAALLGAVVAGPGTHRQRVARGLPQPWQTGPVLDECCYPEVLVARAVSDGEDLQAVLRPGAGAGRRAITVARLRPEQRYDVRGAVAGTLVAGADGRATLDIDLDGRVELTITPGA